MATDLVLFKSRHAVDLLKKKGENSAAFDTTPGKQENSPPEILFITSYPPRECGIATYSQDLIKALSDQFGNSFQCTICALETDTEQHEYANSPKFRLNTDCVNAFAKTAFHINRDANVKLVVLQHEFGFFAKNEDEFKILLENITKPVVIVFHTVLPNPDEKRKAMVCFMAKKAASVIVMTKNAADILTAEYHISDQKITMLPHGTHLTSYLNREKLKKHHQLSDRKILSTFGLLSSGKSIETTLNAMPEILKKYPDILFLVLGKTHPSVLKSEGEKYRNMLEAKVAELAIEKHVRFINTYLPLPLLLEYLQLTDIYLFTSSDPNQAVSGTFSYAVSTGCPVISTPIPHAKEVLSDSNELIIDFGNSTQLAITVVSLLENDPRRMEISKNGVQRMAPTAWQNSAIGHALLFKKVTENKIQLKYKIPTLNFDHLENMTTTFGLIQFAKMDSPDIHSDYTLDDNARAMIAICQHYDMYGHADDLIKINTYLRFIEFCFQPNGVFLNYVNEHQEFTSQNYGENLEDSNGRAIWALGYLISLKNTLPLVFIVRAEKLLEATIPHLQNIHSTRAMAFIVKGLYYQNNDKNILLLQTFANRLVQMYRHEKSDNWHWFENCLTYGNSLLPEAMLCAYLATNDPVYKKIAKESFEFLLSVIFIDGKIKVVSNKEWLTKDKTTQVPIGGEQPIDVAYTIMALEKFFSVFKKSEYKRKAITAFNWFLGANHLHQIVYNPYTGGCYDGIEEKNINLNQGAESTVCYLLSRLTIERIMALEAKKKVALKGKKQHTKTIYINQ